MNDSLDPETIDAWLRAHPDFLAQRPALYRALTPPQRVHASPWPTT